MHEMRDIDAAGARLAWETTGIPDREQFLSACAELLGAALPSDDIAWNAVDLRTNAIEVWGSIEQAAGPTLLEVAEDHPMVVSYLRERPLPVPRPRRMSDVAAHGELVHTRAYNELLRPYGAEHQLTVLAWPIGARGARLWVFNRRDHDYTDRELDLAVRLQPVLVALDRGYDVMSHAAPDPMSDAAEVAGLTAREIEVLEGVARGLTARAIGHLLRISERTVRKHLEHCYAKLDCSDRLVAVDRARRLGIIVG